jgi:hypothetical protein
MAAAAAAYGGWCVQELVAPAPRAVDEAAAAAARTRASALLAEAEGAAEADSAAAAAAAARVRWCQSGALLSTLSTRQTSFAAPRLRFFQARAPAPAALRRGPQARTPTRHADTRCCAAAGACAGDAGRERAGVGRPGGRKRPRQVPPAGAGARSAARRAATGTLGALLCTVRMHARVRARVARAARASSSGR